VFSLTLLCRIHETVAVGCDQGEGRGASVRNGSHRLDQGYECGFQRWEGWCFPTEDEKESGKEVVRTNLLRPMKNRELRYFRVSLVLSLMRSVVGQLQDW
jgi:hypothetical protein